MMKFRREFDSGDEKISERTFLQQASSCAWSFRFLVTARSDNTTFDDLFFCRETIRICEELATLQD